jgi:hypothetical protein
LARELRTPEEEWKALSGWVAWLWITPARLPTSKKRSPRSRRFGSRFRVPSLRTEFLNDKREVYDALIAGRHSIGDAGCAVRSLERSTRAVVARTASARKPIALARSNVIVDGHVAARLLEQLERSAVIAARIVAPLSFR